MAPNNSSESPNPIPENQNNNIHTEITEELPQNIPKEEKKKDTRNRKVPEKGKPLSFWLAIILSFLFIISFAINGILLVLLGGSMAEPVDAGILRDEKFVDGDKTSPNKVLLIPVEGAIIDIEVESPFYEKNSIVQTVKKELEMAAEDQAVKAVIFSVNSPGGGITECDIIYKEILKFQGKRPEVPVIVSMEDIAASGGYYIAAPAQKIFAQPTTITGSIGVIMQLTNFKELFEKLGLKNVTFKSGKLKDIGSGSREMTPEEEEILNSIIKEMSSIFLGIVKKHRNLSEDQMKIVSDARVFSGKQAQEIGLVDEIGYPEDAFAASKELAKIENAQLVKYRKSYTIFDLLQESAKEINPEAGYKEEIDKIFTTTPRLMYMWNIY